ncbi:MAG: sodium/proton-translocating pyrophosphatase, partial [Candidatus Competibacteraceae bacterium]|nr:sodium/proton-translocating pyrophosphatase [Candidatus Competibacteraceae bacterium]
MISASSALARAQYRGIVRQLLLMLLVALGMSAFPAFAATPHVSEANLVLPNLGDASLAQFLGGVSGATLLSWSLLICLGGLLFGAVIYLQVSRLPVHRSMAEVSELIYETCKTYMITQGKFLLLLEAFIAVVIVAYFGWVQHMNVLEVLLILAFSLIGIAGSMGVAWFGIRINTLANSRTAFAALRGHAYPVYAIPLKSGISIGMLLISTELLIMLAILLFVSPALAGKCFIGFAIGES